MTIFEIALGMYPLRIRGPRVFCTAKGTMSYSYVSWKGFTRKETCYWTFWNLLVCSVTSVCRIQSVNITESLCSPCSPVDQNVIPKAFGLWETTYDRDVWCIIAVWFTIRNAVSLSFFLIALNLVVSCNGPSLHWNISFFATVWPLFLSTE